MCVQTASTWLMYWALVTLRSTVRIWFRPSGLGCQVVDIGIGMRGVERQNDNPSDKQNQRKGKKEMMSF